MAMEKVRGLCVHSRKFKQRVSLDVSATENCRLEMGKFIEVTLEVVECRPIEIRRQQLTALSVTSSASCVAGRVCDRSCAREYFSNSRTQLLFVLHSFKPDGKGRF